MLKKTRIALAAVFFILALWRPIYEMFPKMPWLVRLLSVSCVASFGTMPLIAFYFHRVALLGPLLSIILIPLTTVIIYLALAAMLLPIAPLGWMLDNLVAFQERILEFSGNIPFATMADVYPSVWVVAMMYGAMVIAIIRLRTR